MKIFHNGKKLFEGYGDIQNLLNTFLSQIDESGNPIYPSDELAIEYTDGEKKRLCENHIYVSYPPVKQQSDIADKNYYETLLKAKSTTNLEEDIVARTERFFGGESIEEVVADVAEEDKEAYIQLLKVAIRVKWVQDCKAELKEAVAEGREPNFPKYPL